MYELVFTDFMSINIVPHISGMLLCLMLIVIILLTKKLHNKFTVDNSNGPQKIHKNQIPRIGGLVIILSLFFQLFQINGDHKIFFMIVFLSGLPAFIIGFAEEITKKIKPNIRLISTIISALLVVIILDLKITKINIQFVDDIIMIWPISIILTLLSIVLLSQALNIIDGLDGLALGTSICMVVSVVYLSLIYDDKELFKVSSIFLSSFIILFLINFITGKIFLGDGGAYFIGYFCAVLLIVLSLKHEQISPFAILLIVIFPIYETLRSFFRRLFSKKLKSFEPDNQHFHSIVYVYLSNNIQKLKINHNFLSSLITLILPTISSIIAIIFHKNQIILIFFIILFIIIFELLINIMKLKNKNFY